MCSAARRASATYPSPVELIVLAGLLLTGITWRWGRGVSESVVALLGPSPEYTLERANARNALARVIVLAVLADDELSDEEWVELQRLYRDHPDFDDDPRTLIEGLRFMGVSVKTREDLEGAVRRAAVDLDDDLRRAAFAIVAELAARGSGLASERTGYRLVARKDPAGLIEVFARALGIPDEQRAVVLSQLRESG